MAQSKTSPERLPRPQNDEKNVTQCTSCRQLFTVVVRKHHCVSCTKAFCGKCSRIRAQSEQGALVRLRYCVLCEKNHTERNITRNGLIIRQQKHLKRMSSPQLTIPPSITFREAKKLMKDSLLAATHDQTLDSLSGSDFSHRPSISTYRRSSTMSPGDLYSYRHTHNTSSPGNNSYSSAELVTPDISYVDPDSSVIDGNTSILGTDLSMSDMNTIDLDLDLSDIEQFNEDLDSSREHDRGYNYTKSNPFMAASSNIDGKSKHVKPASTDTQPMQQFWPAVSFVLLVFVLVAIIAVVAIYCAPWFAAYFGLSWFAAVPHNGATIDQRVAAGGAVVNIVVVVNNKSSFGMLGSMKRTVVAALGPLAEALQDVDDVYI